jgi:DNA-binding transcriptional MerR regulator
MSSDAPLLLTVRDAAARLHVTPRTLKYYEERGLVTPTRSEGRYRLYDEASLEQFARIFRLRSLGFSLHGITEMLKRPLEPAQSGRRHYSQESLQQIHAALAQQVDALDKRIDAVHRELKEAARVRAKLRLDLDYVERRLAGESADQLLDERYAIRHRNPPAVAVRRKPAKHDVPVMKTTATHNKARNA